MQLTRRGFVGHLAGSAAVVALGGATLSLEGCSPLTDLETWVPIGLTAFDGIASIVDGPFTMIASTVDALWGAVQNAISLYQNSTDPQVTRLDKLIAALDALAGGLTQALAALPVSIPAATLTAAKLALALLIATLKSIRNRLQPPAPAPAGLYAGAGAATPAKSRRDFVNKFNAIMSANGQSLRIK